MSGSCAPHSPCAAPPQEAGVASKKGLAWCLVQIMCVACIILFIYFGGKSVQAHSDDKASKNYVINALATMGLLSEVLEMKSDFLHIRHAYENDPHSAYQFLFTAEDAITIWSTVAVVAFAIAISAMFAVHNHNWLAFAMCLAEYFLMMGTGGFDFAELVTRMCKCEMGGFYNSLHHKGVFYWRILFIIGGHVIVIWAGLSCTANGESEVPQYLETAFTALA